MLYTVIHGLLAYVLVLGVLFSNTPVQMAAIASCLVILLCMIRFFDGCFWTTLEETPTLSDMGLAFSIGPTHRQEVPVKRYEEIVVANLLLIHLLKILSVSVLPIQALF